MHTKPDDERLDQKLCSRVPRLVIDRLDAEAERLHVETGLRPSRGAVMRAVLEKWAATVAK
jgi:hypothetical protein